MHSTSIGTQLPFQIDDYPMRWIIYLMLNLHTTGIVDITITHTYIHTVLLSMRSSDPGVQLNDYRNTSYNSRVTIRWITEGYVLTHTIVPRSCMKTMVIPYHLQLTDGWYPLWVESARALKIGVGCLIGVTFLLSPTLTYLMVARLLGEVLRYLNSMRVTCIPAEIALPEVRLCLHQIWILISK